MDPDYDLDDPSTWPSYEPTPLEKATSSSTDPGELRRMALDPSTDAEVLWALARRGSYGLRSEVATNPNAPVELLSALFTIQSDPADPVFDGYHAARTLEAVGRNPMLDLQWLDDSLFPCEVRDNRQRWLFTYLNGGYAFSYLIDDRTRFSSLMRRELMATFRGSPLAQVLLKRKVDFDEPPTGAVAPVHSLQGFFSWLVQRSLSATRAASSRVSWKHEGHRAAGQLAVVLLAYDRIVEALTTPVDLLNTTHRPIPLPPGYQRIAEHFAPPGADLLASPPA